METEESPFWMDLGLCSLCFMGFLVSFLVFLWVFCWFLWVFWFFYGFSGGLFCLFYGFSGGFSSCCLVLSIVVCFLGFCFQWFSSAILRSASGCLLFSNGFLVFF